MLIGYARASIDEPDPAPQLDALTTAGCERCFTDTPSGSVTERQLTLALAQLRDGQDTLVVWRLDRLGPPLLSLLELFGELDRRRIAVRSLTEGLDTSTPTGGLALPVFAAIAGCERHLVRERSHAGRSAARARGRLGGRPPAITRPQLQTAREMIAGGEHTMQQIADTLGVGRATLYRHLDKHPAPQPAAPTLAAPAGQASPTVTSPPPAPAGGKVPRDTMPSPRRRRASSAPARIAAASDRRDWIEVPCPTCHAGPGARCRQPGHRRTRPPTLSLHLARGWRQRSCPTCHAPLGQQCLTPSGRTVSSPHAARLHQRDPQRE